MKDAKRRDELAQEHKALCLKRKQLALSQISHAWLSAEYPTIATRIRTMYGLHGSYFTTCLWKKHRVQLSTRRWVEEARHAQQVIQKVIQRMDECYPSEENYNLENAERTYRMPLGSYAEMKVGV
ncbi:hypothetical protein N7451_001316 [Penicillium sp. IBT 35674x]|nr:hypothetical protein N7451_001316 [Penicillium sp. IBT 35674x]